MTPRGSGVALAAPLGMACRHCGRAQPRAALPATPPGTADVVDIACAADHGKSR